MQKKIETKADLELLIHQFYAKLLKDESMAPFFTDFDMEHHMPRMVDFWAFLLFSNCFSSSLETQIIPSSRKDL